jgi:hypothetical protein
MTADSVPPDSARPDRGRWDMGLPDTAGTSHTRGDRAADTTATTRVARRPITAIHSATALGILRSDRSRAGIAGTTGTTGPPATDTDATSA